jgi:hypothetical protein
MQTQPTAFGSTASTTFEEPYDVDVWYEGLLQIIFNHFNHFNHYVDNQNFRGINDEFKHMWT